MNINIKHVPSQNQASTLRGPLCPLGGRLSVASRDFLNVEHRSTVLLVKDLHSLKWVQRLEVPPH